MKAVRELIGEVAGLMPYEKHLMDILKVYSTGWFLIARLEATTLRRRCTDSPRRE